MKRRIGTLQIVYILVYVSILTNKILGLLPFHLDRNTKRLTRYRFPLLYPTVFVIFMIGSLIYSYSIVIPETQTQYVSDTIQLVLSLLFIAYFLNLVFTYINHYTHLQTIEDIFSDFFTILRVMSDLKIRLTDPDWKLVALLANFIVIPFLLLSVTFWRLVYLDVKGSEHYVLIFMMAYPNYIITLVPGMFYNILAGVYYIFRLLNNEIRTIMIDSCSLETDSLFRVQQRLCDLSDSLDAIGKVHLKVLLVTQRITNMLVINLIMWIMFKGGALLLTIYTCYTYCIGWALFDKFEMPIQILTFGILTVLVTIFEIIMFAQMCWLTMYEVICILYKLIRYA